MYEIEIKIIEDIADPKAVCIYPKCKDRAVKRYEVGIVSGGGGHQIDLCADHDSEDSAYELYRREMERLEYEEKENRGRYHEE